jgi:hypothetical protein
MENTQVEDYLLQCIEGFKLLRPNIILIYSKSIDFSRIVGKAT